MLRRFLPILASLFLLCACATQAPMRLPADLKSNEAMLAPGIRFAIPIPAGSGRTLSVTQSIVAHYGERTVTFAAQIQIAPKALDLVALDAFGRRALTLHWTDDGMRYSTAPWLEPKLRPADILADIAIVYWPRALLAPALSAAGLTLTQTERARTLADADGTLVAVSYGDGTGWNRSAALINYRLGYTLAIQSAEIRS